MSEGRDAGGVSGGVRRRGNGAAAALLLLGAALIAGAAFTPWSRRGYRDALSGPLTITLTGGDILPALVPVSLVVLAAWAAAAISRGMLRRILALCAAAAGLGVGAASLLLAWRVPDEEFAGQLRRPAEALGSGEPVIWGVLLAVLGGLAAAAGGILLARTRGAARSARGAYDAHDAPAARREAAAREAAGPQKSAPVSAEIAAEQFWRSLDVGVDPTAGVPDAAGGESVIEENEAPPRVRPAGETPA